MSYYIGVFDPKLCPSTKTAFVNWFKKKAKWNEKRDYNSLEGVGEKLSKFYKRINDLFPSMNDTDAWDDDMDEEMEERIVDYTICKELIYMCSAWSVAEEFNTTVKEYAKEYELGILEFDEDDYVITLYDGSEIKA